MRVPFRHGEPFVPEQLSDVPEGHTGLSQLRCKTVCEQSCQRNGAIFAARTASGNQWAVTFKVSPRELRTTRPVPSPRARKDLKGAHGICVQGQCDRVSVFCSRDRQRASGKVNVLPGQIEIHRTAPQACAEREV